MVLYQNTHSDISSGYWGFELAKSAIAEIAVYSGRKELVEAIKNSIKKLKIRNLRVESFSEIPAFLSEIQDRRDLCVVLDLERGIVPIIKVLKEEMKVENRSSRPSLIFADEISDHVVQLATEYTVTQIHSGPISEGSVHMTLEDLFKEIDSIAPLQEQLIQVGIAREQDDWEDAQEILDELLEAHPGNERVLTEIAENHMHFDEYKKAYDLLEPIIKGGTKDPRVMNLMSRCLLKLNKPEEASKVLSAAHLLNPFNVDRLIELGHIYLHLDKNDEAKEKFEEAMDLDPGNREAGQGVAQTCLLDGEINEGLKLLRQVANKRELASIFNTAGILSMRKKQVDKAINLYNAALKALEGEERLKSKLYFNSGIAHFRSGSEEVALKLFEQAVQADPSMDKARKNCVVLGSTVIKAEEAAPAPALEEAKPSIDLDDLDEEDEFL